MSCKSSGIKLASFGNEHKIFSSLLTSFLPILTSQDILEIANNFICGQNFLFFSLISLESVINSTVGLPPLAGPLLPGPNLFLSIA